MRLPLERLRTGRARIVSGRLRLGAWGWLQGKAGLLLLWAAWIPLLADGPTAMRLAASSIRDPDREGLELARRLRNDLPAEATEVHGILETTPRSGPARAVPIASTITLTPTNWLVVYRIQETNGASARALTIRHAPDQPNTYHWSSTAPGNSPAGLTEPFAGSDFWVQDLGLEFFHWPQQRILRADMSRGRACRVLQSSHPHPPPESYSRVLSWIDLETGGVLQAEAFDPGGKLLKKFSLGSLEKVQGRWKLRDMKIRNARTGSVTELKFQLNEKQ